MSFINKVCECCGESDNGYALSELRLTFGYGSENDGEEIRLALCGKCADDMLEILFNRKSGE